MPRQRLDAALLYGSFAQGEGDPRSDIEFWLFFVPEQREANPRAWCSQVGPMTHIVVNEFGAYVAFFTGLVRGEFHFATSEDIDGVRLWPAQEIAIDRMIVLDRRAPGGAGSVAAAGNGSPAHRR